jgi:diguanylate cyclase (GGDEF)-like protein
MSVLFLDVDNFKAYNDTYGHAMGDDALAAVADCIEAAIQRPGDIPARYGGEEFVVILPDMSSDGAMVFAEKLRAAVESLHIAHSGSAYRVVTVSIGCACGLPRRGGDVLALIGAADAALYDAKSGGRSRVAASHIHDADRAGVQ